MYMNALLGQQEGTNPVRVMLDTNNIPAHNLSMYLAAGQSSLAALLHPSRM